MSVKSVRYSLQCMFSYKLNTDFIFMVENCRFIHFFNIGF